MKSDSWVDWAGGCKSVWRHSGWRDDAKMWQWENQESHLSVGERLKGSELIEVVSQSRLQDFMIVSEEGRRRLTSVCRMYVASLIPKLQLGIFADKWTKCPKIIFSASLYVICYKSYNRHITPFNFGSCWWIAGSFYEAWNKSKSEIQAIKEFHRWMTVSVFGPKRSNAGVLSMTQWGRVYLLFCSLSSWWFPIDYRHHTEHHHQHKKKICPNITREEQIQKQ